MESLIDSQIRRTNGNILIANLFFLGFLLVVSWFYSRYYYNFFYGPFSISPSELNAIENPDSQKEYFVSVHGDTTIATDYTHIEQKIDKYSKRVQSEKTIGYYQVMLIEKRLLIVLTETPNTSIDFVGSLEPLPYNLKRGLVGKYESPIKEAFLPFILNATSFRNNGYWGLLLLVPAFSFSLWNIQNSSRRYINSSLHPIYKSLQTYGEPLVVAGSIDNEFRLQDRFIDLKKCKLTLRWLIIPTVFRTDFVHLGYILWIYKERTKHSTNFIPTGTSYKAVILTRTGRKLEISAKEPEVNRILETIYQRIPWIQLGYSDELKLLFKNNLEQFISTIDAQREDMLKQNAT